MNIKPQFRQQKLYVDIKEQHDKRKSSVFNVVKQECLFIGEEQSRASLADLSTLSKTRQYINCLFMSRGYNLIPTSIR